MILSARSEAIRLAGEKLALHPLYLDTETTGNGPGDEIIQVAILDEAGQAVLETLVKPSTRITPEAQRVHGLTETELANAPRWFHVWPKVEAALLGKTVGIYNADFDLRLIQQTNSKYRIRWSPESAGFFCIMKLYAQFFGEWNPRTGGYRYQSLEMAGRQLGITWPERLHDACQDALLARAVLQAMAQAKG
jgi:DNA polymerase-3 subunit epsilon